MTAPSADTVVAGHRLLPEIESSIRAASQRTGIDFGFLVAQAGIESGFRAGVRAQESSAAGLFQFTNATWLRVMREYGAQHGYGALAKQIKHHANGTVSVADKATERRILDLRRNVPLAAMMAAEYAKENGRRIETALGRPAAPADLHLAHLLGPNGAVRFLRAQESDGEQSAANIVPAAARRNPALFYAHGTHAPISVAAVYRRIQQQLAVPMQDAALPAGQPARAWD